MADQNQQQQHMLDQNQQQPQQHNMVDPNQKQHLVDPNQQQHLVDPNQQHLVDPNQQQHLVDPNQQQHLVDPNQQQHMAPISIPVTIQTVTTTDNQQHEQHVAIPIGVHTADTADSNAALQQLQEQVQQQVTMQQLQQQQQIQETQIQVDQIEQQVRQINEEARIEQQQQQQEVVASGSPATGPAADDNDTVQIPLHPPNEGNTSLLNESVESDNSLNKSVGSEGPTPVKKRRYAKYTKRYNVKWESEPGIKEWIRRVPGDDTRVQCRYCQSAIRAHHTELKKHAQSAKHKSQAAYVSTSMADQNQPQPHMLDQNQQQQQTQQQHMVDPNQQQQHLVVDPNQQQHLVDPNQQQQNLVDPNQQQHLVDPNQQQNMVDPNQQHHLVDPNQQQHLVDPSQQQHLVDPNQQQHLVDPNQQQHLAPISIPVTIQTVTTTDNQQHEQHVAIPIGVHAADTADSNAALQQLQEQVQQQVTMQQLQQQQQIQATQIQVDQIEQQVRQINEEARIEQQQQEVVASGSPATGPEANDNDTVQIPLHPPNEDSASQLNESVESDNSLNKSAVSESPKPVKKKPWAKYKKRYNVKWESEPGIKEWIRRVPGDDTRVQCRYCQSAIRAHHTELKKHAQSAKHKSQAAYVLLPFFMSGRTLARMVMRAVRVTEWGGPEVLQVLQDIAIPEPRETQVLIKVGSAGVNPVETYIRSGQYANLPSLPWTPGNDCAGTVEIVGPDVTRFKPGDRVYTYGSESGTYAEYTMSNEENVYGLPDQLDFKHGAALGIPYFTAYRALFQRAHGKAGQTVLVHGASGAVGVAAVQFAKAYGMNVLGTAGTPQGMEIARKSGASVVFNHRSDGYMDQIMTATSGEGVDIIIEMLANVNLQKDLEILAPSGTVAVVGNRGTVEINPRLLMPKESSIVGVMLPKGEEGLEARKVISAAIRAGIESGWLKPHIGKEFPLEGAPLAHTEIMNGNGAVGRIVLVP